MAAVIAAPVPAGETLARLPARLIDIRSASRGDAAEQVAREQKALSRLATSASQQAREPANAALLPEDASINDTDSACAFTCLPCGTPNSTFMEFTPPVSAFVRHLLPRLDEKGKGALTQASEARHNIVRHRECTPLGNCRPVETMLRR